MAERKETYIGNSKLKNSPEKFLKVVLGEQVVKSKNIANSAVTSEKLAGDVVTSDKIIPRAVTWDKLQEEIESRVSGALQSHELDTDRTWQSKQDFAQEVKASSFKVQDFDSADNKRTTIISGGRVETSYNEDDDEDPESSSVVMNDRALSVNLHKGRNSGGVPGNYSSSLSAESLRMGAQYITEESIRTDRSKTAAIEEKLPSAASSTNQLADKNFVNSSISTATANFKGTNTTAVDETAFLQWANTLSGKNLNDYVFWQTKDSSGNTLYKRYKYTENNTWLFEYSLNNSSFTSDQWATINSGLTSNDKTLVSQASTDASTAKTTANNALTTSNSALTQSATALNNSIEAKTKVANFEGLISGTSPILEFSTTTEYGKNANQVHYCYKGGLLYRAIATHVGAWNDEHFEAINMIDLLETYENMVVGDKTVNEFDPEKEYTAGDPVIYNNEFYIFKRGHTGEWDEIDVDKTSFIEWLKNLSDTIETYVGNGKEQVVVSCSTEAQGVSMAGLTLMVYLNGSTTEAEEYTTDSHGMATFRIPVGYTYRIVYPSVAGVVTPAPETHTASVGQRSVEVRYDVPPATQTEKLSITFKQWSQSSGYTAYQGQVKITYGGTTTTYTAGTDGTVMVEIPIGTSYTIEYVKPEDMYIHGNVYRKSLVAERTFRYEIAIFSEFLTGVFITDSAGNDYTLEYFQSLVEGGTMAREDAKFFHVCTNTLFTRGVVSGSDCCFYVSIYEISKRKYHDTDGNFSNWQWCSNNVRFTTIPDNVYQYDGKYRTAQIIAEGIDRGDATPAATRLSRMSYTLTDENNTTISGFLGSRGQWDALWNNRTYIDEMLDYLYDGAEHLTLSSFTSNKWSSDQNGTNAYYLSVSWNLNSKNGQYMAVPFYA